MLLFVYSSMLLFDYAPMSIPASHVDQHVEFKTLSKEMLRFVLVGIDHDLQMQALTPRDVTHDLLLDGLFIATALDGNDKIRQFT